MVELINKTLLLVEDDPAAAGIQKMLLESLGYSVYCVLDGESALNDIRGAKSSIDLILMDIDLGEGIDGTETARLILKTYDIPIIFLSSHIEKEIVEKTEKITSYGYVVKNSGLTVLDASIKMAFKLFDANIRLKNHERKLIESERRFDMLAEQNRTVAWEVDAFGMYTYLSSASKQVFGYLPEELAGKKYYYELCPESERKNLEAAASKVFEKRDRFVGLENPVMVKDGGIIWVSTNGFPVFNDDGSFRGYCGTDIDITELRRTAESLSRAHEQLSATLNSIPDLLFEVDINGRFYDFRAPDPERLYISPEEFLGRTVRDVLPPEAADIIENAIKEAAAKGSHIGATYMLHLPVGSRWFELSIAAKGDLSCATGRFIVVSRDITEHRRVEAALRESEEKYMAIFRDSPIAIELFDSSGCLQSVNYACLDLFGIEDPAEIMGFNIFSDPNIDDEYMRKLKNFESIKYQVKFDFEKVKKMNFYRTHKSGSIWLDVIITPLDEAKLGYLAQIQDITERKTAEEKLRDSEERFRRISEDMPGYICSFLPGGEMTYVNHALAGLIGMCPGDLVGHDFFEMLDREGTDNIRGAVETLTPQNPSVVYEQTVSAPGGGAGVRRRWTSRAFFDDGGKILRYLAVGADITDNTVSFR